MPSGLNVIKNKELLTIIVPVHNETMTIGLFFERTKKVIDSLNHEYDVNLLFMDNCSTDDSRQVVLNLRDQFSFIYLIALSRNVGYQKSIECGLRSAKGDLFVVIDVDCEDPPEMISEFLLQFKNGFDLVYGIRVDRSELWIMKKFRKIFYRIIKRVSDDDSILYMAEFALMTAEVRDAVVNSQDSFPFFRSSMARVGFRRLGIPYKREKRISGETHYNFYGMFVFAVASILSSTTLPLRIPIYTLPFWTLGMLLGLRVFLENGDPFTLYLLMLCACLFIGGTLSAIALYLSRIYKNSLRRPNYFIQKRFSIMQ
jgi:dolichol-phosphate mannosyltransferase